MGWVVVGLPLTLAPYGLSRELPLLRRARARIRDYEPNKFLRIDDKRLWHGKTIWSTSSVLHRDVFHDGIDELSIPVLQFLSG